MLRIWTFAAVRLASSVRPMIRGTTSAARIAKMATTTIISMNVNPRSDCRSRLVIRSARVCTPTGCLLRYKRLPYHLAHFENGKQDGHHDEQYDHAHHHNHDRFEQGGKSCNDSIDFPVIDLTDSP